jgi:1-deoxy-D-xylulose-5-phosphate reductoisomerase
MANKGIAIYGSTGSIGTQSLDVVQRHGGFDIITLVCDKNIELMEEQIRKYHPVYAGVVNMAKAQELSDRVADTTTEVVFGKMQSIRACTNPSIDTVVNSTVGISGLVPTIEFIRQGKNVALANKESLVAGGSIVMPMAARMKERYGTSLEPIDSEHSALKQLLKGESSDQLDKVMITASGGPFRTRPIETFESITPQEALKHPTWKMGDRITIDCATLMNKGFEVIEAAWLFNLKRDQVEILVNPTSKFHAFVQFKDGVIKAHLGEPDMRAPIQYALYPERKANPDIPKLQLAGTHFDFDAPDYRKFRCLGLAFDAMDRGGTAPAVLNGADEMAVKLFTSGKIPFNDIPRLVESALKVHKSIQSPSVMDVLKADEWARGHVMDASISRGMLRTSGHQLTKMKQS